MRRAASASGATGFSMRACTPASASCTATSSCRVVGTQTTAMSRPRDSSSSTVGTKVRCWVARSVRGSGSAMPTSSTPGSEFSTRAWCRPICPNPTSPARRSAHGRSSSLTAATTRATSSSVRPGRIGSDRTSRAARSVSGSSSVQVVRREPVGRDGVVDGAVDAARVEPGRQRVPVGGPDGVLVPDRLGLGGDHGGDHAGQLARRTSRRRPGAPRSSRPADRSWTRPIAAASSVIRLFRPAISLR